MIAKKCKAIGFVICSILVMLSFAGVEKQEAVRSQDAPAATKKTPQVKSTEPAGIYLAMGGMAYVEIVRDASGTLSIKGTSIFQEPESEWQVFSKEQKLILLFEYKRQMPVKWDSSKFTEVMPWELRDYYELLPSSTMPRDWDLVRYDHWFGFTKNRPPDKEIPRLKQPITSYLHRLDDRRVVDYFSSLADYREVFGPGPDLGPEPDVARLFELASGLLASYPDDLYVRTLYLDALVRKRDDKTLEEKLAAWKEAYTKANDPYLRWVFQHAENHLYARRLTASGKNAYDFVTKVLGSDTDLATRLELFPDILNYQVYARPKSSIVSQPIANFLQFQISVKVFRVGAVFLMLQGKREEALKILTASYHLGLLLNQGDTLISKLIGIALRSIASAGLEVYALNCCETPDDFRHLWEALEELNRRSLKEIVPGLSRFISLICTPELYQQNMLEADIRHRCADAKFQLVRMAAAAKHRFVTQGAFPRNAAEFAPLLPDGPPKDPFGRNAMEIPIYRDSNPMKFISDSRSLTCYSIGPDEQDNRAAFSYDPSNGTISLGDIFVKIPYKREYPFPRNGVRAASSDQFRKQFPNGLPPDPFADTRGKSLGITNTTPVYVYSFGPDTNEEEARRIGDRYVPDILYDPTNGTISYGDLFIAIPE